MYDLLGLISSPTPPPTPSPTEQHSRYPEPQNEEDAQDIERIAEQISGDDSPALEGPVDKDMLKMFSFTCSGSLAPLCAVLGGWTAQEVLKGLTGKFTPLLQVLCLDAMEVGPRPSDLPASFLPRGDRYDLQRICLGDELCGTLAKLKLFMIGCGAIGCELMKNFALLGISAGADAAMVITDNDVIEKSNLNRQFLFRPQHIQQPKSVVAAASVLAINPGMKITAHQHKVGPATTETVYTDAFFESRDIVVNALVRLPPPPLTAQPQDVRPLSYGRLMCSLTLFRAAFPLSAFRITCKRGCLSTRGASHAADRCWSRAPWGPRATCRSSCRT